MKIDSSHGVREEGGKCDQVSICGTAGSQEIGVKERGETGMKWMEADTARGFIKQMIGTFRAPLHDAVKWPMKGSRNLARQTRTRNIRTSACHRQN